MSDACNSSKMQLAGWVETFMPKRGRNSLINKKTVSAREGKIREIES